ncbi:MAG: MFS transporter [Fibrobacteria bacterium]|nr:MFS transporter [Fibrobacteria bacterium]
MTTPAPVSRMPWLGLVIVASLGYFVDIYDLILFNVIKNASLGDLGYTPGTAAFKAVEVLLFNWQMGGMLLGGLLWGVLGDRKGRVSALFGSILLYSLANLANAFVHDMTLYQVCRFLAGVGLAGELGAGVTLVSESMPRRIRGWGTVVIVTFGTLGAVVAFFVGKELGWRNAFITGGVMGLALLVVRMRSFESGMFRKVAAQGVAGRGNVLRLFATRERATRYLACIAVGLPIWFAVGVLVALCARFAEANGARDVVVGQAVVWAYIGISFGDLVSGFLSQFLQSRRKVIFGYLGFLTVVAALFLALQGLSATAFYVLTFLIGTGVGYWALFVTVASEQFGTDLRSTVANTVPNFVRGAVVPITLSFAALSPRWGVVEAASMVGGVCLILAVVSVIHLEESFGKELDYLED